MTQKGALILHGLTGTPATMATVSTELARRGYVVESPIIAGHGETPEILAQANRNEWFDSVLTAYERLAKKLAIKSGAQDNLKIFCAGLSLGSLLTLKLALHLENQNRGLSGIACLGTPLKLSALLSKVVLPLTHLPIVRQIVRYSTKDWERSVRDPIGRAVYRSASLEKIPVAAVWELTSLENELIKELSKLRTPTIIMHSRNDTVALPMNASLLAGSLGDAAKKIVWLENSEHVLTLDNDKDLVATSVADFFDSLL